MQNTKAATKLQRESTYTPMTSPVATAEWTLPTDLLLEIIARSECCTLVRCAAACKLLRRDILGPPFIRRVTRRGAIMPHCILACWLNNAHRLPSPLSLSLVHPDTPAAASYLNDNISPYLSSNTSDLIGEHVPVTSRGGLVLFRRRHHKRSLRNLCVLDTVSGHRTFISDPPGVSLKNTPCFDRLLLLTAEDGIGCPFLLFLPYRANMQGGNTEVRAATWSRGTWERAVTSNIRSGFLSQYCYAARDNTVILQGGVIHWLLLFFGNILTYNVCTREQRFIRLPCQSKGGYHLGSYYSHDGLKLLRLLVLDGFKISVWNRLPGGGWASEAAVIDMEEKLRSLDPDIPRALHVETGFKCSGERGNVVLLHMKIYSPTLLRRRLLRTLLIVLDMELNEMRVQDYSTSRRSVLLEIDLPSHLRAMKTFPLLDCSRP